MSVYVDQLRYVERKTRNWRHEQACHLMADTVAELHEFAGKMQLKRCWFHNGSQPHYDLTANKRLQALIAGAIELVDGRSLRDFLKRVREENRS